MSLPQGSTKIAREFARAIVRRKWVDVLSLLTASLRATQTVELLASEFGWGGLGPRLRQQYITESGIPEEMVSELDPPKRFEIFEVEDRDAPIGQDATIPFGWVEVDFQPSEDSEFDRCYNCFLAFVEEDGPKITAYAIEDAME